MPPKKQDVHVPEVEELLELPPELAESSLEEPKLCMVLGHLAGHCFRVQQQSEEEAPVQDFDPCALLMSQAKQDAKSIVYLERDELQAYCTEAYGLQDQPLWAGLKFRLSKERAARQRSKFNDLRRKLIAELEDPENSGDIEAAPQVVDVLFLLDSVDLEELQAMSAAGLYEVVDLWANIHFAGQTLDDSLVQVDCGLPELSELFLKAIASAPPTADLAHCAVCSVPESHLLAFGESGSEESSAERLAAAVMEVLGPEASSRRRFQDWLEAPRIKLPEAFQGVYEDRLYHNMMSAVNPTYHDIPLFLHCLTDQVELSLSGEAQLKEDEAARLVLEEHFRGALQDAIKGPTRAKELVRKEEQSTPAIPGLPDSGPLLPHLDRAACHHRSGAGSDGTLAAVHDVLSKVHVPGRGSGLPAASTYSAVEREALRHRIYPFAPGVEPHELEQLLLIHAFQDLMARAAPERPWCFADRRWREKIPRSLLGQFLEEALKTEPFVDSAYLPRYDCLLMVLYHRSVPGEVLWHAWHGDMLARAEDSKWSEPALVTMPTYNDWSKVHGGSEAKQVSLIEDLDAREIGYNAIVEKLACPSDGSLILVTSLDSGLRSSFESEPREKRRMARVMKDGITFGMTMDETWQRWQRSATEAAADTEPADDAPGPESKQAVPFPDSSLGSLWVSLPNGARVTARLHHERAEGLQELGQAGHPLPAMGAMLTYAARDGQVIQVFSDGAIRFTGEVQSTAQVQGAVSYLPGCAEDYEVSRMISEGCLVKRLVSGRLEIFHADGTCSMRNPTKEELEKQLEAAPQWSQHSICSQAAKEDLLKRILQVYDDTFADGAKSLNPMAAMPGHWVTLRSDGEAYGREDVEGAEEYEMESVATALQVDLSTRHKALTNALGFASFEDPEGVQKVCVYPDGTRITSTIQESGKEVEIFRAKLPLARCEMPTEGGGRVQVECADGTCIEVVPGEGGNSCISLTCRAGHVVKVLPDGTVHIITRQEGVNYVADCREGQLLLTAEGGDFVLHADQTLLVPGGAQSPRCQQANKAYSLELEEPVPPAPAPRLLVVHGNGEAEELLSVGDATAILEAAKEDGTALVLGPEDLHYFKCHTLFQTRLPDALSVPLMGSVALPDTLDGGGSICSVISEASQLASCEVAQQAEDAQAGTITEFRQLLEYPEISEEDQLKLQGTLKQYRTWEAEELKKMRDAAKPVELKKAKKDKGKEKVKEKGKKGKRGKNEQEVAEVVVEVPPEPAFAQDLKLNAFDHTVQEMGGRAAVQPMPEGDELLSRALAVLALSLESEKAGDLPEDREAGDAEAAANLEDDGAAGDADPSSEQENIAPSGKVKKGKRGPTVAETEWSFSYFKSETGLQFLMETGMLDPEMKPVQAVTKEKRPRPPSPKKPLRSPWHPRLVGEPEDEPEEEASPHHEPEDEYEWPGQPKMSQSEFNVPEFGGLAGDEERLLFRPGERFPIAPMQEEAPVGPHPDKKAPMWDVYGEPRGPKAKISQAYVGINADYLEVEGPTGRKVNCCALAHKRTEVKGLGDNHMMVEVVPGACRFGVLRQGSLYRMHFFVRNLEVDVTRFNVKVPDSKQLRVCWQPGQLAPGMAAKLTVEVLALEVMPIQQLVEISTKAHVIRVPITARVIGAEEYDRLDAESMALHGRRIGRHRERSETHRPGPVQLITDASYCKKVMGSAWQPLPTEFDQEMLQ